MDRRGRDVSDTLMTPQDPLEHLSQSPRRIELPLVGQTLPALGREEKQEGSVTESLFSENGEYEYDQQRVLGQGG